LSPVRQFLLLLRRDGHSQLVYKHAISDIMPARRSSCSKAAETLQLEQILEKKPD